MNDDDKIRAGSVNIFADLGYADAETHLLKAQLVLRMKAVLDERGMTQTTAAKATGVSQPDISRMLSGQFRDVSVERLMRMLTRLGCAVDIVIRPGGSEGAIDNVIHL